MNATAENLDVAPAVLGIIAGSGELPRMIIRACQEQNRPYFLLGVQDAIDAETLDAAGPGHTSLRLGAIGKAMDLLHSQNVTDIVLAGRVTRPKLSALRPDMKGTKLLARIGTRLLSGDNELLSIIVTFLEEEGFRVCGADDVVRDLLAPEGMIGSIYPDKRAQSDIEFGAKIARAVGGLDIGQAVIVQNGQILGIEAIEGTDQLITRCAPLKIEPTGGVLIKVKKPQQEKRVDLPTIGVETVERIAECGFAGIAIEAGASLIISRRDVARRADALGIFLVGFSILD